MFMSKTMVTLESQICNMLYVEYYTFILISALIKFKVNCTSEEKNEDPRRKWPKIYVDYWPPSPRCRIHGFFLRKKTQESFFFMMNIKRNDPR